MNPERLNPERFGFCLAVGAALTVGVQNNAHAHHPSPGASSASGAGMNSLVALRDDGHRPWRLSLSYSYSQQRPQPPVARARTLQAFGDVGNHVLSLGTAYWWGAWNVQAQLPFGFSQRSQSGLARPRVWGLGDLRLQVGRLWKLLEDASTIRLLLQGGLALPTGRFRPEDEIEASYLEPDAQTGVLGVRRVRAQTGLGSGVLAGIAALSLSQRWHQNLRGLFVFDAAVPFSSTRDGQRWGADLQARALLEVTGNKERVFGTIGPEWLYHGVDRWSGKDSDPAQGPLDLELRSRQRWGLRAGIGWSLSSQLSCAAQGVVALWQTAEPGVLRETLGGQASCQWSFGKVRAR